MLSTIFVYICLVEVFCCQLPGEEYQSLVDFYHSTNGNHWHNNTGWEFVNKSNVMMSSNISYSNSVCSKYVPHGIICNLVSNANVNNTDIRTKFYHIVEILFSQNNLNGTIPDSIGKLNYLAKLHIEYEENLGGLVPFSLYKLNYIKYFTLRYTSNFIHLGDKLCNWNNLTHFHFETKYFINRSMGYIPDCIGNQNKLNNIQFFQISTNFNEENQRFLSNQTLPLQSIFQSSNLSVLHLNHFEFESSVLYPTLPKINNLTLLTHLQLYYVHLQGIIPDTICRLGSGLKTKAEKNINSSVNNENSNGMHVITLSHSDNLTGTIPVCIFEKMFTVGIDVIDLGYNKLNGTLPTYAELMYGNYDHNYNYDTIEDYNFENNNDCEMQMLYLFGNQLYGTIPDWITKCNYSGAIFLGNNQFDGTLPNSFITNSINIAGNNIKGTIPHDFILSLFDIDDGYSIDLSDNQLEGTIPQSFINMYTKVKSSKNEIEFGLFLHNNKFDYLELNTQEIYQDNNESTSRFNKTNNKNVSGSLFFHYNNLKNDNIGDILNRLFDSNVEYTHLTLNNNPSLSGSLNKWTTPAPSKLSVLALHDCNIGGKLFDNQGLLVNKKQQIDYITMYNNRLSCDINDNFVINNYNVSNFTSLILLGNLFTLTHLNKISLLYNDPFTTATSLYADIDSATAYIFHKWLPFGYLGLASLVILCTMVFKLMNKNINSCNYNDAIINYNLCYLCQMAKARALEKNMNMNIWNRQDLSFLQNDDDQLNLNDRKFDSRANYTIANSEFYLQLLSMFSNWIILMICIVLTTIYYLSSNYYLCGNILSHFALTYYYWENKNSSVFSLEMLSQVLLTFAIVIFNIVVVYYLQKFESLGKLGAVTPKQSITSVHKNTNGGILINNEKWVPLLTVQNSTIRRTNKVSNQWPIEDACAYPSDDDINYEEKNLNIGDQSIIQIMCGLIAYMAIYTIGNSMSILYIIFQTLPRNNTLNVNTNNVWMGHLLIFHFTPGFVITLINVFIVPQLIDKLTQFLCILCTRLNCSQLQCKKCVYGEYRSYLILYFRSLTTLFIPFIAAMILLPKCGNKWTSFWIQCNDSDSFSMSTTLTVEESSNDSGGYWYLTADIEFASHESICQNNKVWLFLTDLNKTNQCVRSFLDLWTPTICIKLFLFIVTLWITYYVAKWNNKNNCKRNINSKCGDMYRCRVCACNKNEFSNRKFKNDFLSLDVEYASLATKLELFVIFMPFIPFICPIMTLALYSNYKVFYKMTSDLKWQMNVEIIDHQTLQVTTQQNIKYWKRFPFKPIHISLIFGQILFVIVVYDTMNQQLYFALVVTISLIHVSFVAFNIYQRCKSK